MIGRSESPLNMVTEKKLYRPIRDALQKEIDRNLLLDTCYLEVTADGKISERIKVQLDDAALYLLKTERRVPDIIGIIYDGSLLPAPFKGQDKLLVVEVKKHKIRLEDVYQIKSYAEIFKADHAVFITCEPVPEELKRIFDKRPELLGYSIGKNIAVAQFDVKSGKFVSWFPSKPF